VQVKDSSNTFLPNSVRNNQSQNLWMDFKSHGERNPFPYEKKNN